MDEMITADHGIVRKGDRAFNYYDGVWVTVGAIGTDGWASCTDDQGRIKTLNGERLAIKDPKGSVDHHAKPEPVPWRQTLITLPDGSQIGWLPTGQWHHRESPGACWSLPLDESTTPHEPGTVYFGGW